MIFAPSRGPLELFSGMACAKDAKGAEERGFHVERKRTSLLTSASTPRYIAPMPIQFILPKKFTRAQIEWRMDELALQFQGTKDRKIIAQIAALNRVLAKMDVQDSSKPKNRQ
jgi:hypothetical protein